MPFGTETVEWQGRPVAACVPDRIADLAPALPERTVRATEQAAAAVRRMGDREAGPMVVAARLLLRSEGVASSAIEGVRAPAEQIAAAQLVGPAGEATTAAWVADNLAVVAAALEDRRRLSPTALRRWQGALLARSNLDPAHVGRFRDRLGWIGGATPQLAAHVAPRHERVPALVDDLCAFAARDDVDPVTQAAVVHAQFETIHPFADGNGRIGRILIGRTLAHRLGVAVPPPVSVAFSRDVGGYLSGLTLYRQDGLAAWVDWFARAVVVAAEAGAGALDEVAEVHERWRSSVADLRADALARRVVEVLPAHPVLTAAGVVDACGGTPAAARRALDQLVERAVLVEDPSLAPKRPGRPDRWFVAPALLALLAP